MLSSLSTSLSSTTSTLASFDDLLCWDDLEEGATLDLVAVGGVAKSLDVLLVLGGGDKGGSSYKALVDSGVAGHASDLAGDALHALLGLNNGLVHILDPVNNGVGLTDVVIGISLPSDGGEGDIGGEEEEESDESQDRDEEGGQIEAAALRGAVRGSGVAWFGGSVSFCGGTVTFCGGGIAWFWGPVGGFLGGAIGVVTLHQMCTGTG